MLRVDGDNRDLNDYYDSLEISRTHYETHYSAEIMIRMSPPLGAGVLGVSDYDLLLIFNIDHFEKNQEVIGKLHVGTHIKFTGYL